MEGIRPYLLSVSAAALVSALIITLVGEKAPCAKIIKLLTGIFLITVILKPTIRIDLTDWKRFERELWETSTEAAEAGERLALEAMAEDASLSAQSLIKKEAEKLGCQLEVTVDWEALSPKKVTLEGEASPYAKNSIAAWISENMGIPQEAQVWIG